MRELEPQTKKHDLRILVRHNARSGRTQKESRRTENDTAPANAHGGALSCTAETRRIFVRELEPQTQVHELRILVRCDGRSGRTQKESRRTDNGTAPANAHGGALETTQARNAQKRPRKTDGRTLWPTPFHILSMFVGTMQDHGTVRAVEFADLWRKLSFSS